MSQKPNKTVCAFSKGIMVCMSNKKRSFIPYESAAVRDLQLHGRVKYQKVEHTGFSLVQQRMYAEAVYGLTAFTEQEIVKLTGKERHQIIMRFKRVQDLLNQWKQEIVDREVNSFLSTLFPKSSIVRQLCSVTGSDPSIKDRNTFRSLNISQRMIAEKLVAASLLPANFFELA